MFLDANISYYGIMFAYKISQHQKAPLIELLAFYKAVVDVIISSFGSHRLLV